MTLPLWPEELPPAPLVERYQEVLADTTIRTKMDQGPAKTRQRTTAGVAELNVSYLLSRSQTAVLENFFADTLAGGSISFIYPHPRREAPVTARFRKPPQISARNGQYYMTRLELEVLP